MARPYLRGNASDCRPQGLKALRSNSNFQSTNSRIIYTRFRTKSAVLLRRIKIQNNKAEIKSGKVSSQRVERTGDINDTLNTVLNTLSRVLFVLPE